MYLQTIDTLKLYIYLGYIFEFYGMKTLCLWSG